MKSVLRSAILKSGYVEDNFIVFASNRFIEWFEWWTLEIFYLDDILQRRLSTVGPTLKRR